MRSRLNGRPLPSGRFTNSARRSQLKRRVLPLELLQPLRVISLQPTDLVAPAVMGLLGYPELAADIGDLLALAQYPIGLNLVAHQLLWTVPLVSRATTIHPRAPVLGLLRGDAPALRRWAGAGSDPSSEVDVSSELHSLQQSIEHGALAVEVLGWREKHNED